MSAENKSELAKAEPVPSSTPTAPQAAEEAPDPDEDDLDDLDEVLDEFATQAKPVVEAISKAAPTSAVPLAPATAPEQDGGDFDEQLQKEMAKLMGDVDDSPEMKKHFEEMMKELGSVVDQQLQEGNEPGSSSKAAAPAAATAGGSKAGKDSFEETIRKTMERMQTSDSKAKEEASTSGQDDFLEQMLKSMQGEGNDEDFSKMLLGMMEQLTNKEILYEPMKDLHNKFPGWMEKNKEKTPAADLARYTEQQKLVKEIVARFERPGYHDDNAEDREYIVERMQQMQAAGSPPQDLVGDMDDAQKAFGDLDQNCPQQ